MQPPRTKCFAFHAASASGSSDVEANFAGELKIEIGIPICSVFRLKPAVVIAGSEPSSTAQLSVLQVVTSMNAYIWGFFQTIFEITPLRRYVVFKSKYVAVE